MDLNKTIGDDEALLEAGNKAVQKEIWKGELMTLLKGLRGTDGWSEDHRGPRTDYLWGVEGHSNYYLWLTVTNAAPPTFGFYIDPDLRGSTTGFRGERPLKNYKAILSLPKSLQAFVVSELKKAKDSPRYEAAKKVASLGVPHDLERAYQTFRQVLIPAVEPEDTHTTGYEEPGTEETVETLDRLIEKETLLVEIAYNDLEKKLIRLGLDPAAASGEVGNSGASLFKSLRSRGVTPEEMLSDAPPPRKPGGETPHKRGGENFYRV
jgi:hypothetical protein